MNTKENHEKPYYGYRAVRYESLKEAGVNLGGLVHIWEIGYLSGRKV